MRQAENVPPSEVPDLPTTCDAVTVVVITRDRRTELLASLAELRRLPERPRIIVVDNASSDGSAGAVGTTFPDVDVVRLTENLGAAGRNVGASRATTPYVAFSDDDSWWAPGALARAAVVLDAYPGLALVAARVLVGPAGALDPTCAFMATSGIPRRVGVPGVPVFGFVACGAVVRREPFLDVGGFPERLGIGGEEAALSLALVSAGSSLAYVDDVVAFHHPSTVRDGCARRTMVTRNDLWIAWEYRSARVAVLRTLRALCRSVTDRAVRRGVVAALLRAPSVLAHRRPVPDDVERTLRTLDAARRSAGTGRAVQTLAGAGGRGPRVGMRDR
ncbi:MAG TPA: glycosyltransferase [Actinomycetota bacterium]|nr:glycosyltransferase [Actinomycetota bacterium]